MSKKVDVWRWIERAVLVGGIIGMYFKDEVKDAVWKAEVKKDLEVLKKNDEKQEEYWENNLEWTGTVNEFIRNSINSPRPTEEETEGN
jgi:hypothetical protein